MNVPYSQNNECRRCSLVAVDVITNAFTILDKAHMMPSIDISMRKVLVVINTPSCLFPSQFIHSMRTSTCLALPTQRASSFMFTINFANFVISSAYALSGHVSISITSPYSLFEARRPAHLLLQSVTLTFEGQTEIFTTSTGYSAVRLCTVTRELVPGEPIELSNAGHDLSEPCK